MRCPAFSIRSIATRNLNSVSGGRHRPGLLTLIATAEL